MVEQGRFAGALRTEDGDQMVVEAGGDDFFEGQIVGETRAAGQSVSTEVVRAVRAGVLEFLILVDDLDAVLVLLGRGLLAHGGEVAIHDD